MEWFTSNLAGLVPLLVLFGMGIGYLIRRQMSGQAHFEDQESLERTIKLKQLLDAEGLSIQDVKELREQFRNRRGSLLGVEARALAIKEAEQATILDDPEGKTWPGKVPFKETNVGISIKAGAELDNLNGQLNFAIVELAQQHSERRALQLYEAQAKWESYREAESEYAALLLEGGTGANLVGVARMIELTEQRLRDVALHQADEDL